MDLFDDALEKISEYIPKADDWGMVFYSDGGYRHGLSIGGWGLHGYVYDLAERKQGYGLKNCEPTNAGYVGPGIRTVDAESGKALRVTLVSNCQEVRKVNLHCYIDGYGSETEDMTNNVAELMSLLNILTIVNKYKAPRVQIVSDSTYVLKGAINHLKGVKKDVATMANPATWKQVWDLLDSIKANGTIMSWDWCKGHKDDIGNIRADYFAGIAMNAHQNGHKRHHLKVSPVPKYWSPASNVHPMLKEPRAYFFPRKTDTGNGFYYYFGSSEDSTEGQPNADKGHVVVKTVEPDPALEHLKEFFVSKAMKNPHVPLVLVRNDLVTNPRHHIDLVENGHMHLLTHVRKSAVIAPNGTPLANAEEHSELLFKTADILIALKSLLDSVTGDNIPSHIALTDVTHGFYEKVIVKKAETLKAINYKNSFVEAEVDVKVKDKTLRKKALLIYGTSMPNRAILQSVAHANPKLIVVTWPDSDFTARYALILKSDVGCGVWCATYSNILFLSDLLLADAS